MLKQCLLILLAFSLIAIAVPLAAAQSNDAPPNSQQPADASGGRHHGMMDPAQHTQELTKKLKLTSDQQSKVQGILESEHTQMESLRSDTSSSQQDRHSKMMDIRQNSNTQIRALLDSTQQKKWDEMQANREERMGRHHGAGASDNPPSQ
jgi:septal ring factor EnvC (AmiA/AmiB activator)